MSEVQLNAVRVGTGSGNIRSGLSYPPTLIDSQATLKTLYILSILAIFHLRNHNHTSGIYTTYSFTSDEDAKHSFPYAKEED